MVAHDDYRPLVDALKTVLQEHGLPQYPSAFGRRVFTAGQEIAMEFYSRGLAEVVVEVLCAFPRVVERMSRAEAADPTEFNCPCAASRFVVVTRSQPPSGVQYASHAPTTSLRCRACQNSANEGGSCLIGLWPLPCGDAWRVLGHRMVDVADQARRRR